MTILYLIDMSNLDKLKNSIGRKFPFLPDVLKWHSTGGRNKYSHFEVSNGEAYFSIYDDEESYSIAWNLDYISIDNQSKELIDWLSELV